MFWLEIVGVTVGMLYLYLEYKASVWLWLAGIIMPAIYIFIYYDTGFYADMGINVYFLLAGLYGWAYWLGKGRGVKKGKEKKELPITHTPAKFWLPLAVVTAVCFALIAFVLVKYTDSTVPYADSLTTALSIAGLWLLTRKFVEQWLVWIVVDVISAGLYFYKAGIFWVAGSSEGTLMPTGILYTIYTVIAVFGYFRWRRVAKGEKT